MQPNPNLTMLNLTFILPVLAIWYFLVIRPDGKKRKETQ